MSRNAFQTFIRALPGDSYVIKNDGHKFSVQPTRRSCLKRPRTVPPYVAGNFHFVYKNCSQLDGNQRQLDDLNDVLFSHVFFPGTGVQWNLLFCTIFWTRTEYVCPICLDEVVAPRVSPCGHIFCADCLQQFFKLSEKHTCPVCSECLVQSELVRCIIRSPKPLRFIKLQRQGMTNVVTPFGSTASSLPRPSDPSFGFTRFSIADQQFIVDVYKNELESIERRKQEYVEWHVEGKTELIDAVAREIGRDFVKVDETEFVLGNGGEPVVFYQADDGSLTFLDPLNTSMLEREFGSLAAAPDVIEAPVLGIRNRCIEGTESLGAVEFEHLPIGAETSFVFLDLQNVCSQKVMDIFACRIRLRVKAEEQRHKKRKEKKRVITKADYQTFTEIAPEEEVCLDLSEFPPLPSDGSAQVSRRRAPAKKLTFDEEYPVLGGAAPAKRKQAPAFYVPEEEEKPQEEAYPSLSGKEEVRVQKKKKPSPWAQLKL